MRVSTQAGYPVPARTVVLPYRTSIPGYRVLCRLYKSRSLRHSELDSELRDQGQIALAALVYAATFLFRNLGHRGTPTPIHILGECHAGGVPSSGTGKVPHRAGCLHTGRLFEVLELPDNLNCHLPWRVKL